MKEEELDWQVYHHLAANHDHTIEALAKILHSTPDEIDRSLTRLQHAMLLERTDGGIRVLSVAEMLLRCQARYDRQCPFSIEGGVIRSRQPGRERDD